MRQTERARAVPLVTVLAPGGARTQEGLLSLTQMRSVAAAVGRCREAGVADVCVLEHAVTGGVWASLAASADVLLARAGALVAFAGTRLREGGTERGAAFTAEGKLAAGCVDELADDTGLRRALTQWAQLLAKRPTQLEPCEPPRALSAVTAVRGWASVRAARGPSRARARAYLDDHFDMWRLLTGDRAGGMDPGTLCGLGMRHGSTIAFVAQAGAANRPAGYRAARRLLDLAERLRLPVLTLIDTPGAAADATAEDAGVGPRLPRRSRAWPLLPFPSPPQSSERAAAVVRWPSPPPIAPGWRPTSYFAVIAPESAAAILHHDSSRGREVAEWLRLAPDDVVALGLAVGVLAP